MDASVVLSVTVMDQQDIIFKEIQELKSILSIVIGTSDRVGEDQFSAEAVADAAKIFKRMSVERGDWVEEKALGQYLGPCPFNAGKFIRKEFAFQNWIKRGHSYLYSKRDLIALGQELKAHNIDLKRFQKGLRTLQRLRFQNQTPRLFTRTWPGLCGHSERKIWGLMWTSIRAPTPC
jgi:hypothetical protein